MTSPEVGSGDVILLESDPVTGGSNRAEPAKGLGTDVSDMRTTSVPHPASNTQRPQEPIKRNADFEFTGNLQTKRLSDSDPNGLIKTLFRLRSRFCFEIAAIFCLQRKVAVPWPSKGRSSRPNRSISTERLPSLRRQRVNSTPWPDLNIPTNEPLGVNCSKSG